MKLRILMLLSLVIGSLELANAIGSPSVTDEGSVESSGDEDDSTLDARTIQYSPTPGDSIDDVLQSSPSDVSSNVEIYSDGEETTLPNTRKQSSENTDGSDTDFTGQPQDEEEDRQSTSGTESDINDNLSSTKASKITKRKRERNVKLTSADYTLAIKLLSMKPCVPVKKRTVEESKIYRKISRYHITMSKVYDPLIGKKIDRLMRGNKIVLPQSDVGKCVDNAYERSKGEGARKLRERITEEYYGIGRRTIQARLNRDERQQLKNPKFMNKAPLKSVTAEVTMERHQIDLVDLSSIAVTIDNFQYRYVLSVLDVFSRYLWLRPLTTKSSEQVAKELKSLYITIGYPDKLQCDRGKEFHGHVSTFCKSKKIRIIYSSPYHPESQGKIERSHGSWKSKIEFDYRNGELNWVKNLEDYAELYNSGIHTALGVSPYEVHHGVNQGAKRRGLKEKDTAKMKKKAHETDLAAAEEMKNRFNKNNRPSEYLIGEKVYARDKPKKKIGKKNLSQPKVVIGKVLKKNHDSTRLKLAVKGKEIWFSVADITSLTHDREKKRKRAEIQKPVNKDYQNYIQELIAKTGKTSLYRTMFLMTRQSTTPTGAGGTSMLEQHASAQGLKIEQENEGQGNCMFISLVQQLRRYGIKKTPRELRKELVRYIQNNKFKAPGGGIINLEDFMYDHTSLESYVAQMSQDGVWGDQIILLAFANLYMSDIYIISSVSPDPIIIEPTTGTSQMSISLGHIHEVHYVSLEPIMPNQDDRIELTCSRCSTLSTNNSSSDIGLLCDSCGEVLNRNVTSESDNEISVGKPHSKNISDNNDTVIYDGTSSRYSQTDIDDAEGDLHDAIVKGLMLIPVENGNNNQPEEWQLCANHNAGVWMHFMEKVARASAKKIEEDGEEFYVIDNKFMKCYDCFQEALLALPFVILYLTPLVKKFLKKYNVGKLKGDLLFLDDVDAKTFHEYMMFEHDKDNDMDDDEQDT